jgi:hypothetical protein
MADSGGGQEEGPRLSATTSRETEAPSEAAALRAAEAQGALESLALFGQGDEVRRPPVGFDFRTRYESTNLIIFPPRSLFYLPPANNRPSIRTSFTRHPFLFRRSFTRFGVHI